MKELYLGTKEKFFTKLEHLSPTLFRFVWKWKTQVKYLFAGGTAAATDLAFLAFFKEIFGFHYLTSAVLAFIVAFGVSFLLQKYWTFGDNEKAVHKQAVVYFGVAVINLGLNTLMMYFFVDIIGIWYFFAQIVVSGLIAIESFIVYRKFVFKKAVVSSNRVVV